MSEPHHITLLEAQERAKETAKYPRANTGEAMTVDQCIFGLVGEIGEVAEKRKKWRRGDEQANADDYIEELSDVLWYFLQLCNEAGVSSDVIARSMLDKLRDRDERGVIKGEGDNR